MPKATPEINLLPFTINRLTCAIALAAGLLVNPAFAEPVLLEETLVEGVRASLGRATDLKRQSKGISDSIVAEELGKFPDSNLAESLQRLTGVSISREGGEGKFVTVRGFGAEYNMVTLNGRTLPAADTFGGAGESSRAFNMANLSSSAVDRVTVYKTGQADISSGGLGGAIDIVTSKPLSQEGLQARINAKAIAETSNRSGDSVTPDIASVLSWSNGTFGASMNTSHSARQLSTPSAHVHDWRVREWVGLGDLWSIHLSDSGSIDAAPSLGQLFALPDDITYRVTDREQERDNALLTLQYSPVENLIITGDFLLAESRIHETRSGLNLWHSRVIESVAFNNHPNMPSPEFYQEQYPNGFQVTNGQDLVDQKNTLKSQGFNIRWQPVSWATFVVDAHSSSVDSRPNHESGGGQISTYIGAPVAANLSMQYSGALPILDFDIADGIALEGDTSGHIVGRGNGNGLMDRGDFGVQRSNINFNQQKTDIDQLKIDSRLEFDNGAFLFGIENRAMKMHRQRSDNLMVFGDWNVANPGELPDDLLEPICISCEFDHRNADQMNLNTYRGDADSLLSWAIDNYQSGEFSKKAAPDENNFVEESTSAIYLQLEQSSQINNWPTQFIVGARYESTRVDSTTDLLTPTNIIWRGQNSLHLELEDEARPYSDRAEYSNLLPNFSASITFLDNLKARLAFSKTLGRAQYRDLAAASAAGTGVPWGSTLLSWQAVAVQTNPGLLPLESNNFDLSVEWYFDEGSLASIGYFEKRVKNFIGSENSNKNFFGLRDVTSGPRAQAALQAISTHNSHDGVIDDGELFAMTVVLSHPEDFPGGVNDYIDSPEFRQNISDNYDLSPNDDDPLMDYSTSQMVNSNREAKVRGFEFGVTHFFGESGFGVQANYTKVSSDVQYDAFAPLGTSQFALVGLSDSANAIFMYEKYGYALRLAYNWRDDYMHIGPIGFNANPRNVEAYGQFDLNLTYAINDATKLSFEALNITGESQRVYGRTKAQLFSYAEYDPSIRVGVQYDF